MKREEILLKLNEVFRDVFDDIELTISDITTAYDIEEWDSLEHINLVAALEKCFNIKFTITEVTSMENVRRIVDVIMKKINEKEE